MADLQSNGEKEMGKYEDTVEDIENSLGLVPGFMKLLPEESLVHDWPIWKDLGEIELERARYLLSVDEMVEEMLSRVGTSGGIRAGRKARTVCCGVLVDTDTAPVAISITGEQFFVCNENCRKFIETATPEQIYEIASQ